MDALSQHNTFTGASQGRRPRLPHCWQLWAPLWRSRHRMRGWLVPIVLATITLAFIGGGYEVVAQVSAWRGRTVWDPATALDYAIPVVPWSVVPYMSIYLYFPLAYGLIPRTDHGRHELILLHQGLFLISAASFAVFLISPCRIGILEQLPPKLRNHEGMPGALYGVVHALDTPYNAWPSLHVSLSLLIVLHIAWRERGRMLPPVLWVAWSLLALSVLTTKQHFVFDLATGVALGIAYWRWVLRPSLEVPLEEDTRLARAG
jgi:hypothetical protein